MSNVYVETTTVCYLSSLYVYTQRLGMYQITRSHVVIRY